jgi:rare lipoprotein A
MKCGSRFLNRPIQKSASTLVIVFLSYACATTKQPETIPEVSHGIASWYGEEFAGRTTANGEIFDPLQFTAAHRTLPFGTLVDITNPQTNQTVRVRINDRGPYIGQRAIDLSYAAAQQIGLIEPGSGDVEIKVLKIGRGDREPPAPYEVKIDAPQERVVIASAEPPKVDFPLPSQTMAPTSTNDPDFHIEVQEQKKSVETRRRVSADGRTIEEVPLNGSAPLPKPARRTPRTIKYIVQVGAFSIEANAKLLQAQLTRIGQQSFVDHEDLYRVRIGPFATREQAVKARTALETSGLSAIIITE